MSVTGSVLFFLVLLALAALGKPVAEKLHLPYPVMLVAIGFIASEVATGQLGLDTGIDWQNLQFIIFYGLIPMLIFHAALDLSPSRLFSEAVILSILALPLMLISTAIIAVILLLGINHPGFPLIAALITGALLSATDPSAVVTVLRRFNISGRLTLLLEGESLFNDATAILLFSLFIHIAVTGEAGNNLWLDTIVRFLVVFTGGIAVGVLLSLLASVLITIVQGHSLNGLIYIIGVYGAFIVAEMLLHVSGVMAVLTFGLVIGYLGRKHAQVFDHEAVKQFWSVLVGIAEILIFLLAGISILPDMFTDRSYAMLVGIVAILVARAVIIFGGMSLLGLFSVRQRLSVGEQTLMFWGGIRGTVTLALALSIPLTLDYWYTIQSVAYGVVLFTLFIQATTLVPVARWLSAE